MGLKDNFCAHQWRFETNQLLTFFFFNKTQTQMLGETTDQNQVCIGLQLLMSACEFLNTCDNKSMASLPPQIIHQHLIQYYSLCCCMGKNSLYEEADSVAILTDSEWDIIRDKNLYEGFSVICVKKY